jgi:hypothetical protein
MKTRLTQKSKQLANVLLTTLVTCAILSMSAAYYLSFVEQQNMLSARSQTWNMAMAIVEAGIEEGLQELNSNSGNLAADGWTFNGSYYTHAPTVLADGNSYTVQIYLTNSATPVVIAQANVALPAAARTLFAAVGATPDPTVVKRAVRIICSKPSPFNAAVIVKNGIDLNGNGVYSDSFDSSNPAKSTNGRYDSAKYAGDRGDMQTTAGISSSVSIKNANIFGKVHTGPNCPVTIGPQGGVGPHGSQVSSISSAISLGYVLQDANFTFPDTTLPSTAGYLQPASGNIVTSSNNITSVSASNSICPNPLPYGGVVATPTAWTTTTTLPSPVPAGMVTTYTTNWVWKGTYPDPGTFLGTPVKQGNGYNYWAITGTYYTYPTAFNYAWNVYTTNTYYLTNHYDNILLANNNYVANSLSGSTYVAGANVTLAMPNGMTGVEYITLNQGANILIYSGGTSFSAAGNQIINPNGSAGSFVIYCAPSVTSFSLSGNGTFTGVLVAPSADVALNGSGNTNQDYSGALVANSIKMNGHFSFHYDESLNSTYVNSRFLIKAWDEITPQ